MGTQILSFLITSIFNLYVVAIILRFLLAYARADFRHPVSQFLVTITDPIVKPLRRLIPAFGKLDTATVLSAILVKFIGAVLLLLTFGKGIHFPWVLLACVVDLVRTLIWIYIIAIIIQAVLSFLGNSFDNPIASILNALTRPILAPLRKVIPTIGMMDLSPLVAILGLHICLIVLNGLPQIY